jgi:RNA polymerase sigma factor (sigma-70 family)
MGEQELIKASAKNDKVAQKSLFEQYYKDVLLLCKRYAKDDEQATEMSMSGMQKVFEQIKKFSPTEASFSDWIKQTVIQNNIAILKSNMQSYYIVSTVKAVDNSIFVNANNSEELENEIWFKQCNTSQALSALQHLPASLRATYNMYLIDQLSLSQMSEWLEISESTAQSNIEKARHTMKRNLYAEYKSK